jgi:hypothetical protein
MREPLGRNPGSRLQSNSHSPGVSHPGLDLWSWLLTLLALRFLFFFLTRRSHPLMNACWILGCSLSACGETCQSEVPCWLMSHSRCEQVEFPFQQERWPLTSVTPGATNCEPPQGISAGLGEMCNRSLRGWGTGGRGDHMLARRGCFCRKELAHGRWCQLVH